MKKIRPYIISPWWEPPKTYVANTKLQAKSEHVESLKALAPQLLRIYTDGNGINGKIRAFTTCNQMTMSAYVGKSESYTVCYAELYGIFTAMLLTHIIINIERQPGITLAIIYTDNQAVIQKVKDPNKTKSKEHLVQNVVTMINGLRNIGAKIELHWVPAHVGIAGNEKANREAKRATGLRTVRKRNHKVVEANTPYTAQQAYGVKPLQKCITTRLAQLVATKWKENWKTETKGRHLRQLQGVPARNVLKIHKGLKKDLSSLIVQMRMGKIGLRKFLYE